MGTRSLTHIREEGETLITIYRQYDGYPTGMGANLKEFLGDRKVTSGIRMDAPKRAPFNGMGDLAARLVTFLKEGDVESAGNVYIYPANATDVWEEYVYTVDQKDGELSLSVVDTYHGEIYDGLIDDFDPEAVERAAQEKEDE